MVVVQGRHDDVYAEVDDWVSGADITRVWQTLRNKMKDVAPELPDGYHRSVR